MSGTIVLVLRILIVVALYSFLGLALWTLGEDLRRVSQGSARNRIPAIRLEVYARKRSVFKRAFAQAEITIGRDPLSDVPVADKAVSARHALLSFHSGQWWLDDLGSKNGTRLNSERLTRQTVLTNGDELRFGQARVLVTLNDKNHRSRENRP